MGVEGYVYTLVTPRYLSLWEVSFLECKFVISLRVDADLKTPLGLGRHGSALTRLANLGDGYWCSNAA